ncbi:hypothetical protein E6W39_01285 [Kitasatospora acidiphila]|uniref:Uncharacterized protein n=1 Tax=Kitasatospora acidiphila TaxID=2567942 RepID=A0A540VWH3_9ACTN|nr:hypothetical protein [Kitasatospora acidiphila]TQF01119.1 hypothetical protein E6W39_01285 [Kitasatospora acidiphila]
MNNRYLCVAVLAATALTLGAVGAPADAAPGHGRHGQLAVWTSSHTMTIWTPQLWQTLARNHVGLFVQVNDGDYRPDADTWATDIIGEANRLALPVTIWTGGNDTTSAQTQAEVDAIHAWLDADRLHVQGIVIDDEGTAQTMALVGKAMAGDQSAEQQLLSANIDPAQQCQAVAANEALIKRAHREGLALDETAMPQSLDDLDAGTLALQDTLNATSNPPATWDANYFQAYRSDFSTDFGSAISPGLITSYYESAHQHLGDAGELTIGVAGLAPYATLAPLVHDVRLLATLGQKTIPVFSLEQIVATYGQGAINSLAAAAHEPLPTVDQPDPADLHARATYQQLAEEVAALTPQVTRTRDGVPQQANNYPNTSCAPQGGPSEE